MRAAARPDLGRAWTYAESFRFLAQLGRGGSPFTQTSRSIALLATDVLPAICRETTRRPPDA